MFARVMLVVVVMLAAVAAYAEAPKTITYQGRITDATGVPIADGPQNVAFRIYDSPIGGTLLWSEPGIVVNTEKGLFTATLGSPTQFPPNFPSGNEAIFTNYNGIWLEITVNGVIQTPRTALRSVPYAVAASDLSGHNTDFPSLGIRTYSTQSRINTYGPDGEEKIRLWGPEYGEVLLYDDGPFFGSTSELTAILSAGATTGGVLGLADGSGVPKITLQGGTAGDGSAQLPDDAINSFEMLNEPGIAIGKYTGGSAPLTMSEAFSTDVASVTITIPTSGYIVVDGYLYTVNSNPTSAFGWAQVSDVSGLGFSYGRSVWTNSYNYANAAGAYTYVNTPVKATFFKAAGTYTFFLQGNAYSGNTAGTSVTYLAPSWVQATFFPTSYGAVMSVAAKPPTDNPDATQETGIDPQTKVQGTVYAEDLRYYELMAAKAHARDMEAQVALEKARVAAAAKGASQRVDAIGNDGGNK